MVLKAKKCNPSYIAIFPLKVIVNIFLSEGWDPLGFEFGEPEHRRPPVQTCSDLRVCLLSQRVGDNLIILICTYPEVS